MTAKSTFEDCCRETPPEGGLVEVAAISLAGIREREQAPTTGLVPVGGMTGN